MTSSHSLNFKCSSHCSICDKFVRIPVDVIVHDFAVHVTVKHHNSACAALYRLEGYSVLAR